MNYEEMTDFEINKAVAEAKGLKIKNMQCASLKVHSSSVLAQDWMTGRYIELNYCKNPSDAWPLLLIIIASGCTIVIDKHSLNGNDSAKTIERKIAELYLSISSNRI